MKFRSRSLVVILLLSMALGYDAIAARGGNKGDQIKTTTAVVVDGNGQTIGQVFSIDRDQDPAVLMTLEVTDPYGVARKGVVGVKYDRFSTLDGVDAVFFTDTLCQENPRVRRVTATLEEQMGVDAIYVVGDQFWMSGSPVKLPLISDVFTVSSYLDQNGICQPYVSGSSPPAGPGQLSAILVQDNVSTAYPPYYAIEHR